MLVASTRLGIGTLVDRFVAANLAIRPICTPQLPSSLTRALDFFLAGDVHGLIASDRLWFGAKA
jgi:hypothetical protein